MDQPKADSRPERQAIVRSVGGTPSEQYLAKLADRSFLNLWSYPNTFIGKHVRGKGDGKELCDLLVICGDHVLIFSDKTVGWPVGDNVQLAWKRWYKRAIQKSVDQIRGAERWIAQFPDRIFLDRQCKQPLPLRLPPPERRKVHGIVVALGAGKACENYFKEGTGSFLIAPDIKGDAHWDGDAVAPFIVGDVDPGGPFIHVLNDATLKIVMGELDTITDLAAYLTKKEQLVRSGRLISAAGEEDLVAYYMTHMNSQGEHDFTKPDGTDLGDHDHVSFDVGFYNDWVANEKYRAKKAADRNSYVWDKLIETFTTNMLAGTTIMPEGRLFVLSELEQGIQHMALVPRHRRRFFGEAILDALEKAKTTDRFTRAMLPGPTERHRDTGFFFMTLGIPKTELAGGYEQYRDARRNMLQTYAFAFLEKYRELKRIVGIATESPNTIGKGGRSEDLIVVEPGHWTPGFLKELEESKKALNIVQDGNFEEYPARGNEYPEVKQSKWFASASSKLNRKQRRALAAKAKKNAPKK